MVTRSREWTDLAARVVSGGEEARRRWLGTLAVALASVSFGVQGVLAKYAYAGGASVPTVLATRFLFATLILWAIPVFRPSIRRTHLRLPRGRALGAAILGAIFVTNSLFYFLALDLLPASTAVMLVFVFPALVALWARIFLGERLSRPQLAALGLALLGCVLTVDPRAALVLGAGVSWLGVLWALGSAFSNSWYVLLAAVFGRGLAPLTLALYSVPLTMLGFCAYLVFDGGPSPNITPWGWTSAVSLGILTGLAIYAYLIGVGLIGPSRAAVVATAEPVTTVVLGVLLLSEALTPPKIVGAACIVAAITLLNRARERADTEPRPADDTVPEDGVLERSP
ncbi:MAG: DMT family transporter [Chloroflexota bacterium]|nr:DMT family transporter [Chloroflexota bacterium]